MCALSPGASGLDHLTVDNLWLIFELRKESLAAVAKSQTRYLNALLIFLAVLWWQHFSTEASPDGTTHIEVLGLTLGRAGLWMITPAVLTVLSFALIGTLNASGPLWARIGRVSDRLKIKFFWPDLDTQRNVIDYAVLLRVWPEGPAEPVDPPKDPSMKGRLSVFSYPAVLVGAAATTLFADYPGSTSAAKVYIYGCFAAQALFGFRPWYRAVCRFLAVRRPQTEV
jgi:hypothetical protein